MATIAIGKRVDRNQPMMEANGYFIRRKGLMFDPISNVIDQVVQLYLDQMRSDAEVPLSRSRRTGPVPYAPEHSSVKLHQKIDPQNIAATTGERP